MFKFLSLYCVIARGCDAFRLRVNPSYLQVPMFQAAAESLTGGTHELTEIPTIIDSELEDAQRILVEAPKKIPIGREPVIAVEGDSTETTPVQRAALAGHFVMVLVNLLTAVNSSVDSGANLFNYIIIFIASVLLGDIGTGIFHWSVDNYGSINTPVVGTVCAAFQGHHDTPWTITFRSFANNVYKICYVTVPTMVALYFAHPGPQVQVFTALFVNWWMLSQEFHKYSHMKRPPVIIKFLQDNNVILSRKEHGRHHTSPFEGGHPVIFSHFSFLVFLTFASICLCCLFTGNYCILTGIMNPLLDRSNFFRHLERIVYCLTGTVPNTWKLDEGLKDKGV